MRSRSTSSLFSAAGASQATVTLSAATHPSHEEVEAYAQAIAHHEGSPEVLADWRQEAELQLWAWHDEQTHSPFRRRTKRQ